MIYSLIGLLMLYLWVGYAAKRRTKPLPQRIIRFGSLCFGVYLLQQFILKGLYDHTNLPAVLGCYWLPWAGFAMALAGSAAMAYLMRKTKTGKLLIG